MDDLRKITIDKLIVLNEGINIGKQIGIDLVSDLFDNNYSIAQLELFINARLDGININLLLNPMLDEKLICCYIEAIKLGIDIGNIIDSNISLEQLFLLIDAKMKGICVDGLIHPLLTTLDLKKIITLKEKNPDVDFSCIKDMNILELNSFIEAVNYSLKYNENINFDNYFNQILKRKYELINNIHHSLRKRIKVTS